MASTVFQPAANRIGVLAGAIGLTPQITAYVWEPRDLGNLPVAVIRVPALTRPQIGGSELQIGSWEYNVIFPVDLYFDLQEPITTQTSATDFLEKFSAQIDSDQGLSGAADEAKVIKADPVFYPDASRPHMVYQCEVEARILVPIT